MKVNNPLVCKHEPVMPGIRDKISLPITASILEKSEVLVRGMEASLDLHQLCLG